MSAFRLRLLAAELHYEPDIEVFTAISGATPHLLAHYLVLERDGLVALSEVRANIAFLTHIPPAEVAGRIRALCAALDWTAPFEDVQADLGRVGAAHAPIARAAVDGLLVDAVSARDGRAAADVLGGSPETDRPTNQCLFWSAPDVFERLLRRYLDEGFHDLKVRIGVADFATDLARLRRVRELGGPHVKIAVDANGAWDAREAVAKLAALEPIGLAYVEQPTRPGDWAALAEAGGATSIPLMLDEGLASESDADHLIDLGPPFLAHLKIVKLGGPRAVVRLARKLESAGVGVMVGQMNEGGAATALTVACAVAARPRFAELYGAYGLVDDPAPLVRYARGRAVLGRSGAFATSFDEARCAVLWTLGSET